MTIERGQKSGDEGRDPSAPKTTQETIDGMDTPTTLGGIFALFAAVEVSAQERGLTTREESIDTLGKVFGGTTPAEPTESTKSAPPKKRRQPDSK